MPFCSKCGNKLPDGARFCAACGAPAPVVSAVQTADVLPQNTFVQEPSQTAAEPVQSASVTLDKAQEAVQTAVQSEPVQSASVTLDKAQEAAQTAVQSESVQSASVTLDKAQEAVQTAVQSEPVQSASVTLDKAQEAVQTAVQSEPVQSASAAPDTTMPEGVQPAAAMQSVPQTTIAMPAQAEGIPAPAQSVTGQAQVPAGSAAPAKKKKSKAPLIAGISAAAVVVGGGVTGYCFRADVQRIFMGDAAYAKMIELKSYAPVKDVIKDIDSIDKGIASSLESAASVSAGNSTKNGASGIENIAEKAQEIAEESMASGDSADSAGIPAIIGGSSQIIGKSYMPAYAGINYSSVIRALTANVPDNSGISTDTSIKVELKGLLAAANIGDAQKVLDYLNDLVFNYTIINGDNDKLSFGIADKDGKIVTAEIYSGSDGIFIAVPEITDKTIFVENPEGSKEISENTFKINKEEIKRIRQDLCGIYCDSFDTAKIEFSRGAEMSAVTADPSQKTLTVKGNSTKAVFSGEQLKSLIEKIQDYLKNDSFLISYAKDALGMTEEEYKAGFKPVVTGEIKTTLTVDNITDEDGNILGKSFLIGEDGSGSMEMRFVKSGSQSVCTVTVTDAKDGKNNVSVSFIDEKDANDSRNGTANFTAHTGETYMSYDVSYTGKDTAKWLDREVATGSWTVKFADCDTSIEAIGKGLTQSKKTEEQNKLSQDTMPADGNGDPSKAIASAALAGLKDTKLTFTSSVSGEEYNVSGSFSLAGLADISFTQKYTSIDGKVTLPDRSTAIDFENSKSTDELSADTLEWLKKIADRNDLTRSLIGESLNEYISKAEELEKFRSHYSAYSDSSEYEASDNAEKLYYELCDSVNMSALDHTTGWKAGTVKLYFDENGEGVVLDDGGLSAFYNGVELSDKSVRSTYAELFYDTRIETPFLGVSAVFTDSKNDIPDTLPDKYNFIDGCYRWDDDEKTYLIEDFVVGTYPYLYSGKSYTSEDKIQRDYEERIKQQNTQLNGDYTGKWSFFALDNMTVDELTEYMDRTADYFKAVYLVVNDDMSFDFYDNDGQFSTYELKYNDSTEKYDVYYNGEYAEMYMEFGSGKIELGIDSGEDESFTLTFTRGGTAPAQDTPEKLTNITKNPSIEDVVGTWSWRGDEDGEYVLMGISSNYIMARDEDYENGTYLYLNPTEDGFDIYSSNDKLRGTLSYSAESDMLEIYYPEDDERAVFTRVADVPEKPYNGAWNISDTTGDIVDSLVISELDIICTDNSGFYVSGLYSADGNGFFARINGKDIEYVYDAHKNTLTATYKDNGQTVTKEYVRAQA